MQGEIAIEKNVVSLALLASAQIREESYYWLTIDLVPDCGCLQIREENENRLVKLLESICSRVHDEVQVSTHYYWLLLIVTDCSTSIVLYLVCHCLYLTLYPCLSLWFSLYLSKNSRPRPILMLILWFHLSKNCNSLVTTKDDTDENLSSVWFQSYCLHSHSQSRSLSLVVMMRSKELKTWRPILMLILSMILSLTSLLFASLS